MPTSDWQPAVSDVGNLLRARTVDRNSREVGTFTADTRPTDKQVEALIDRATRDVALHVGEGIPAKIWDDAKSIVAFRTAMLVEISYFPEQIGSDNSPYNALKDLYEEAMAQLPVAITAAGGDVNDVDPGAPLAPVATFPMTGDPFIIGRRTAW